MESEILSSWDEVERHREGEQGRESLGMDHLGSYLLEQWDVDVVVDVASIAAVRTHTGFDPAMASALEKGTQRRDVPGPVEVTFSVKRSWNTVVAPHLRTPVLVPASDFLGPVRSLAPEVQARP